MALISPSDRVEREEAMLDIDEAGAASITYREIKRRIVDLQYGVGERLSEARLAEELGVGRSPIRTALLRLKAEGWIAIAPQSGTYVKAMTPREIREVADLRTRMRIAKEEVEVSEAKIDDRPSADEIHNRLSWMFAQRRIPVRSFAPPVCPDLIYDWHRGSRLL